MEDLRTNLHEALQLGSLFENYGLVEFPLRDDGDPASQHWGKLTMDSYHSFLTKLDNHRTTRTRSRSIAKNTKSKKSTKDKESNGLKLHPKVLSNFLIGGSRLNKICGVGAYGNVFNIDGSAITELVCIQCVLKKTCAITARDMKKLVASDNVNAAFSKQLDPQRNDAIAEPLCAILANRSPWNREFSCQVLATRCEDPLYWLCDAPASESNSDSDSDSDSDSESEDDIVDDQGPQLYTWTVKLDKDIDLQCREAFPSAEFIEETAALVAQTLAGILSLADMGISHNDLHTGNLMYKESDTSSLSLEVPLVGEEKLKLVIPTYKNLTVHVIDFGLSCAQIGERRIGGNTISSFNIDPMGTLNNDIRTLALYIYSDFNTKWIRNLLKSREVPEPYNARQWNFLREFFKIAFSFEEESREKSTETEKEAEKETEKETEKEAEKEAEKETEKEAEKETEKEAEKEAEKETEKETEKEAEKETEKEAEKEDEEEAEKEDEKEAEEEGLARRVSKGTQKSLHELFHNNKLLRATAKRNNIKLRDQNKNIRSLNGKYHLIREITLCKDSSVCKVTRDEIVNLLRDFF